MNDLKFDDIYKSWLIRTGQEEDDANRDLALEYFKSVSDQINAITYDKTFKYSVIYGKIRSILVEGMVLMFNRFAREGLKSNTEGDYSLTYVKDNWQEDLINSIDKMTGGEGGLRFVGSRVGNGDIAKEGGIVVPDWAFGENVWKFYNPYDYPIPGGKSDRYWYERFKKRGR